MDEREFSERAAALERRLYRVCFALLRCDADCADAVQEALLKAWRALPWLRREEYFETWLTRIAINECRRILRMRRHALELDARLPAPEPPDVGLRDALMALDVQLRLPVVLHYVNGFDIAETARILHLPQGTVKSRLYRARARLRELMSEEDCI